LIEADNGGRLTMGDERLGLVEQRDLPVTMRDGVVLRGDLFRPRTKTTLPALLWRTPYDKQRVIDQYDRFNRYVQAGYAVFVQDTRGRYRSDGVYPTMTRENPADGPDGFDTVEWLAAQPFCNGTVGGMGTSYQAWMIWQYARLRPPHLKAISARTIPVENFEYDWPGAFRPGRRVHWWMATIAPDLRRREGLPPPHTWQEGARLWELEHGKWLYTVPWSELPKHMPKLLAQSVEEWFAQPSARPWRFDLAHHDVEVPNLDVTGWYDHCKATMGHLAGMQRHAASEVARTQTKLIIGPWNHVGLGQRTIGGVDFGPSAEVDLDGMIIRWFDHWLKGVDNGVDTEPPVRFFVLGEGRWATADTWPPTPDTTMSLFLGSDGDAHRPDGSGRLGLEAGDGSDADSYIYDPANPVPTLWGHDLFTVPADRGALDHRRDILRYRTPTLDADILVVGYPEVTLFAASTAPDTDFFAWLIDEEPDGRALDVCCGMVRARHRHGIDLEEPLVPGEMTEFRIRLDPTACRFEAGHRILLEITSSDFPSHDRNHNTGGNDLRESELMSASQTVYHSKQASSRLDLPIQERCKEGAD